MRLPRPRGPLSNALFRALRDEGPAPRAVLPDSEDDLQISLWALYELHYQGFDEVAPELEWEPALLTVRQKLEAALEARVRRLSAPLLAAVPTEDLGTDPVVAQLLWITSQSTSALTTYLHRRATAEEFREFLALRSLYHLKESDPHAWALPRLRGGAKAALAEIQYDEYGGGRPERVHQQLYADALDAAGLDSRYGGYVDQVPSHTLAVNNTMSLFGLHRRLRGASMGHLAAFEMTSSMPCRRIVQGAVRLGMPPAVIAYFDEHVEADAVHEQLASRNLCGALVDDEPELHADILLGAAACVVLDDLAAQAMLADWQCASSIQRPA